MHCYNIDMRRRNLNTGMQLASMDTFRANALAVYCGVPVLDLAAVGESAPPPSGDRRSSIDYLICRGDVPLLAVQLIPEEQEGGEQTAGLAGLLTLSFPEKQFGGRLRAVEQILKKLLRGKNTPNWQFLGCPIGERLQTLLVGERLLERAYYRGQSCWCPTVYGEDCGLYTGCVLQDDGEAAIVPCYSERTCVNLEKLLARRLKPGAGTEWKKTIPFAQRIGRLNEGLSSDGAYSARAVRRFADTPLDDYLRDFPDELADMRKDLPMLDGSAAYKDAAALIYRLFLPERPKELRSVPSAWRLVEILALPLLEEQKKGRMNT